MWQRILIVGVCCLFAVAMYNIPATKIAKRIDPILTEVSEYAQGQRHAKSFSERIEGWRAAYHIFRKNPVYGAGPGNFEPLAHALVAKGEVHEIAASYSKPHSSYFAVMSDCGLLGLFALLAILGMPLWLAKKHIQSSAKVWELGFALVLMVVSFAHFALTEAIFSRNVNISFYVIMVAAIMAAAANEKNLG